MSNTITMNQILWQGDVALVMDDSEPRMFFVCRAGVVRRRTRDLIQAMEWYEDEASRCEGCGG